VRSIRIYLWKEDIIVKNQVYKWSVMQSCQSLQANRWNVKSQEYSWLLVLMSSMKIAWKNGLKIRQIVLIVEKNWPSSCKELAINVYILRPFNNNKEVGGTFGLETRWKRVIICVYVSYDKPFFEKEFFPRFENNKNNYLYFESFEFIFRYIICFIISYHILT